MPNARDVTVGSEMLKCMVVGKTGSGKSVFASSFPTPGYVFDFDKGILTYRGEDFDYDQFPVTAQGWVAFEKKFNEVAKLAAEGKYKTIIFDSASTLTDLAMERAMSLDPKRSATGGPLWNVHYQMVKNLVEGRMQKLMNIPCNLVLIAHVELVTDQETGAILDARPLMTGQLSTKIPGLFDEVYYSVAKLEKGKTQFYLQTVPKGLYNARSRISAKSRILPDFVPNDYGYIMKLATQNQNPNQS